MAHALYYPLLVASATIASALTGCQLSLSYVSVTAILSAPEAPEYTALTMWKSTFNNGFYLCPTQAMLCSAIFFVNALLTFLYGGSGPSPGPKPVSPLLIGGVLAISLVPFTLITIVPLEETLLERHGELSRKRNQGDGRKVHSEAAMAAQAIQSRNLMKKWISRNYVRSMIPAATVIWAWMMC